jgi:hypothetical protein
MSPTLLLALCILSCDFLLYALFRWTYPDRSAKTTSRPRAPKPAIDRYVMQRIPKLR